MRSRTMARAGRIARANKTLIPASFAVATLAAAGIVIGAAASAAAATPTEPLSAAVAPTVERNVDDSAAFYVAVAHAVEKSAAGKADTTLLDHQISDLTDSSSLPARSVRALTALVRDSTDDVADAVVAYDAKVAADAAAAAAAAQAAADALAQANTPDGAKATARSMAAADYGWGDDQFSCLESLWDKESGWNYQAYNDDGGATGIPQSLPGSKMASAGDDWQTNAATQIRWGLGYIAGSYGSPCAAWSHSEAVNWY